MLETSMALGGSLNGGKSTGDRANADQLTLTSAVAMLDEGRAEVLAERRRRVGPEGEGVEGGFRDIDGGEERRRYG